MARPTKLTPEVQERVCHAIRVGAYLEHAAGYARVSKQTLYNWIERGEKAAPGDEPYVAFLDALKAAEGDAVVDGLTAIRDAKGASEGRAADVWTNRAWILERRHPRLYGRTVQEQVHAGSVTTIQVEGMSKLSDAEVRKRAGLPPEDE